MHKTRSTQWYYHRQTVLESDINLMIWNYKFQNASKNLLNVKVKVYEIESGINSNFQTILSFQFKNHFFFKKGCMPKI